MCRIIVRIEPNLFEQLRCMTEKQIRPIQLLDRVAMSCGLMLNNYRCLVVDEGEEV